MKITSFPNQRSVGTKWAGTELQITSLLSSIQTSTKKEREEKNRKGQNLMKFLTLFRSPH